MMKMNKRVLTLAVCIVMLISVFSMNSNAAGIIELDKDVSLTISFIDNEIPLVGAEFSAYRIATVDTYGYYDVTDEFVYFNIDVRGKNDIFWNALASTVEGYILRDKIEPTVKGITDEKGILKFDDIPQGMYVIIGTSHTQDGYVFKTAPFVISLPSLDFDENTWIYDVEAEAKHSSEVAPDETEYVSKKVLKVWNDKGYESKRPKEVVMQILCDGEIYDTVTLNAENNWAYTWEKLDNSKKWVIVEKEISGYSPLGTWAESTFVVTNSYKNATPQTPGATNTPGSSNTGTKLPQTGQLWWPVPILIALGLLFVVVGVYRRQRARYER